MEDSTAIHAMRAQMQALSIKDLLALYYAGMPYSEFDECPPWTHELWMLYATRTYRGPVWGSVTLWEFHPDYLAWLEKEANNEQTQ